MPYICGHDVEKSEFCLKMLSHFLRMRLFKTSVCSGKTMAAKLFSLWRVDHQALLSSHWPGAASDIEES